MPQDVLDANCDTMCSPRRGKYSVFIPTRDLSEDVQEREEKATLST